MNSEERDLISRFFARVGSGQAAPGAPGQQTALPAIDPQADQFIAENFQQYPQARYRITQLAVVQEAALAQAQNRIRELEFQLQQAQSQLAQAPQAQNRPAGGFFSGLFGGGRGNAQTVAPPPGWGASPGAYAPPPGWGAQPRGAMPPSAPPLGMFPRSGGGFLGSALTTAAGVAGGMMAANALENLFSGHHDVGAGGGEGFFGNTYGDAGQDPFGGAGTDAGGGFSESDFGPADDGGGFDDDSLF